MMNANDIAFAPRTIAQARTVYAEHFGRLLRVTARKVSRRMRVWGERLMQARQYQRELAMLMNADERMLKDIGLTRADVLSASEGVWWARPDRVVNGAAARRNEAMQVARDRKEALPRTQSPSTAMPREMTEISNFR